MDGVNKFEDVFITSVCVIVTTITCSSQLFDNMDNDVTDWTPVLLH